MAFDPITAIADLVNKGLDKWIPDANERGKAAQAIALQVHQNNLAQIEVNKIEAASTSLFVAGWRPAVGWVCVCAYAYNFIVQPLLTFCLTAAQVHMDIGQLPDLNFEEIAGLMSVLLGVSGMRTLEKIKRV